MQVRRRKGAAAIAAAVISGLLGAAPGALAAPADPGISSPDAQDPQGADRLPSVWPKPQSMRAAGGAVPVGDEVFLLTDEGADPYAVEALREVLRSAGARMVSEVPSEDALPPKGLLVRAGSGAGSGTGVGAGRSGSDAALRALKAPERADLPTGGYRLAAGRIAGRDTLALQGVGEDGLFHAVQTLRQLIRDRFVPGVQVRDWPGTAVRGMTEGFYGTPWTREQRLAQLDFMGRTKQNRYVYAPGDDPYRQARWREPYPADERADFRALAERARRNHVTLTWAVSPGQAMCMASDGDVQALIKKLDAMWALGVRSFQLQFQDVSYSEWHCDDDADTFGSGPEAAAKAQARVANAVAAHLKDRHRAADALSLMPTEFFQDGATEYRAALARELKGRTQVAWTGVGVVPRTITGRELAGARGALKHPLMTMDNYPVNDYAQDRIFLGPYTGREPAVATGSAALLANAMEQPAASRIPLFTAADYAWNPRHYRPEESWRAAIDDLAGPDRKAREAVAALAGNDASSVLGGEESAYLRPLVADFWRARESADQGRLDEAGQRLRAAFGVMAQAPERLKGSELAREVKPWLDQLARYGTSGELAVDMLLAQAKGEGAAAWTAARKLNALRGDLKTARVTVGKGVLDPFLDRARRESAAWTGAAHPQGKAEVNERTESSTYTVRLPRPRPLDAVTAMAAPGAEGTVEAHVPGEGWRALGKLADGGWTETGAPGQGARVDAVRVTGDAARVERLVPWYADGPAADLSLARAETDAEIGGTSQRVAARLTSTRPGDVQGKLTTRPPKGITVRTPADSRLPRGTQVSVPVEVTVAPGTAAGTYDVPVSFGEETRTLTVRAYPRTAGPDLARSGQASSSGDETRDFPASAANDGDAKTRWSSPAADGAWWQLRLREPVRLGQVVLHWQDAYASRYRVQVSADGRTWRTAATVKDGKGGRESVRMDAREVRFVRVQGEERATRFGYSLWSVEAYAVKEDPR